MAGMRALPSLVTALSLLGVACSSDDSAPSATGGISGTSGGTTGGSSAVAGGTGNGGTTSQGGRAGNGGSAASATGGGTSSGGSTQSATGGVTSTGGSTSAGSGGATKGGESGSAAAGAGGSAAGGSNSGGLGGAAGISGAASGGSAGSGGGGAAQSAGCGKARTLQNGTITIMFNNASRKYILRVPENYDNKHPYRLVFAYAESGSSATSVADRNYFRLASLDGTNTIFVAPDAANGQGQWSKSDVELTDAILAELEADLCIDKTRIFATGFSFGGAMSIALACTRADVFRGVAFFSGADLTGSCTGTLTKPIAYYASQASGDSSGTPMPSSGRVKQAEFAAVNGCTAEPSATTFPAPGEPHKCTVYKGCSAGHPTVYCVFDGAHGWEPTDPGQSMSWNPPEAWKFITQF